MRLKICDHAFHLGRWNADLLAYVATVIQPVVHPMPHCTHRHWLTEHSNADLPPPLTGRTSHLILVNDILKVYQFAQTATLVYEKVVTISLSLHAGSNRTHMPDKKRRSLMSIAKIIELSAESPKSFEDAIQTGITRASKTIQSLSSNSKCNTTGPEGLRCCYANKILSTHECGRP